MSQQILHGTGQNRTLDVRRNHDRSLHEQKQNQRADIDVAKVGQDSSDRSQSRFGDTIEEVTNAPDNAVAGVEYSEGRQRLKNRGEQNRPPIEIEDFEQEPEQR